MKNKRIVIIGDSLSMPRPDDEVEYEDTYPYLLGLNGYEVVCKSKRANDTKIQSIEQNILDDIVFIKPNILVIHLGIVDCAPRLFSRLESRILSILPSKIRNKIINFFSKRRLFFTKIRRVSYVKQEDFSKNIEKLIERSKKIVDKIIIIKIYKTTDINELKSYEFQRIIERYNGAIDLIMLKYKERLEMQIVDPNEYKEGLLSDGIHINSGMHQYLANQILKIIKT